MTPENMVRKASSILRKKNNLHENMGDFFKNLLADLAKLGHYRIVKLSSNELYIKDKLIPNTLTQAEDFLKDYNEYMGYHTEIWCELMGRYRTPKDEEEWLLAISSFKNDLRDHLQDLSERARAIQGNLIFIENKYEIDSESEKSIKILKNKFRELSKITYDSFMDSLFNGKSLKI